MDTIQNNKKSSPVICIVEDESIVALDLKRFLLKNNYQVGGIFNSGDALLSWLRNHSCDIILMDIKINGSMDGVETAGKLDKLYNIPVILLTAFADDSTLDRAKKIAPYGYIIKPYEERELKTTIEMAVFRHSLEKQLYESEERYRLLFEEDLSGDFLTDGQGFLIEYNSSLEKMLEMPKGDQSEPVHLSSLFPSAEAYEKFFTSLKSEHVLKLQELRLQTMEKRVIVVLANIIAKEHPATGGITEIKGYLIDVTDRKNLEDQLRQSQKMEAVGRLAGGVAHDFNNLLTVIIGYCSMIKSDKLVSSGISQNVAGILDATKKATALTRQLLAFSRQQILNPQVIQVRHLLINLEKMLHRLLPDNISLYYSDLAEDSAIFIDPGQLEQVIINLVVNSRDAIPDGGGLITLSIENHAFTQTKACNTGSLKPGEYVCIIVRDTGEGIDKEILSHIFDPFFTTKPQDKGTGLGLAMVYGIISQSGGVIDVETKPGKGASFQIYLPRIVEARGQRKSEDKEEEVEFLGDETILLVEDDPKIMEVLRLNIANSGYTVLCASNPGEAILILEQIEAKSQLDLVISDFLMPYMNGIELINRIRKERPGVKYLLISGFPEGAEKIHANSFSKKNVLLKPFSPEELLAKIRQILDT